MPILDDSDSIPSAHDPDSDFYPSEDEDSEEEEEQEEEKLEDEVVVNILLKKIRSMEQIDKKKSKTKKDVSITNNSKACFKLN